MCCSRRVCTGLVAVVVSLFGAHLMATPLGRPTGFALQTGTAASGMTNQDVIKMVAAGLAEDVIVTAIRQAPRRALDLTPSGLIDLKLAKVPDAIVRAMQALEEGSAKPAPEQKATPTPSPAAAPAPPIRPTTPPAASPPPPAAAPPPPAPPPPPSTSLQEPSTPGELFFVAPTGTLTALERVRMRDKKVGGARSQGAFKGSVQDFAYYFDGASSPVTIKSGDPQVFVIRMLSPTNSRWGREATADEAQKHFLLTKLQSEDGRRFLTKVDVQFDVRSYGRPTPGLDPKKFERLAVSFQLTPRTVLPPGEYVVRMGGAQNFEFVTNLDTGDDRWAFAIVER